MALALCVSAAFVGAPRSAAAQAADTPAAPPQAVPAPIAPASSPAPAKSLGEIKSINVTGNQRLEAETIRSYIQLRPGASYTTETLDQALKDLFATELFADVRITGGDTGDIIIAVRESPVINRIVIEGNKRLKEDKIRPEIRLAARQIFTRSKVRADVARIIELYRRQGRFAATVEPKMVSLDQNRVDIIFEITEGQKSKVRQINIIGNEAFNDGELRSEMATKQSRFFRFFSSSNSYDPDRLAYDQAKLRQFYLTQGYADFRVVSAVAELTPDKRDFIITYVVEEGRRYKFGGVKVESDIRDFKPGNVGKVSMKKGDWYNAKMVEDTVESLTESAGLFGYAFAEVSPEFNRDKDALTMDIIFRIGEAPRVYVERIDINGNTLTQDKVVRREFRLAEGDAFNSFLVKRSTDRIKSLGFFQENLQVEQKQGSAPDRVILETNVEEKSTGELQLSAGFSSLESFIASASIRQRNFRGKGQELRASASLSSYSKSVELGFTEPYLFDKTIAVGGDIFRRDYSSFNYINDNDRNTTYQQVSTGFQLRAGVPITEFVSLAARYTFSIDDVSLNKNSYYINGECSPLLAGRYLCDAVGNRTTSSIGYSLVYDTLNNRVRPTGGQRAVLSQDFAGLGGSVRYLKTRAEAATYTDIGAGFIGSLKAEGGAIIPLQTSSSADSDPVRLTDRFFLGQPQFPGFDIRGIGPRVIRRAYDTSTTDPTDLVSSNSSDDSLGGRYYYLGRAEIEIPLGSGARELGLRPSIFAVVGSVFGVKTPTLETFPDLDGDGTPDARDIGQLTNSAGQLLYTIPTGQVNAGSYTTCAAGQLVSSTCVGDVANAAARNTISPFYEEFLGNSWKPRLSVGFGVNWNSPFGPFRIDIAKALLKQKGDDTRLFTFNIGTQF
ncbi:outer membrane protein insertion porin family [Sphingomonas zeicaulis]|uniref:outer membrane protein assembly factor BamA n=1 Tax=Sphingomonas zeicaulis TaxID=1632740 RepID=UPI003D1B19F2